MLRSSYRSRVRPRRTPVLRTMCSMSRAMLQTVNTYRYARGPRTRASFSSRRYCDLARGGRPARGASGRRNSFPSIHRFRHAVTVLRLTERDVATSAALAPEADIRIAVLRLQTRRDFAVALQRSRARRCCRESAIVIGRGIWEAPLPRHSLVTARDYSIHQIRSRET